MWDLWRAKCNGDRFRSKYFFHSFYLSFALSLPFSKCVTLDHPFITDAIQAWQLTVSLNSTLQKEINDLVIQRVSHLVRRVFTYVVITGALCNGPVFVAVVSKDVISLLVILGRLIHSYWMKSIYLQWKPRPRETAGRRHQPAQGRLTPHFCTRPNHGYLRCWAACTSRCTNREFLNISLLKFSVCVADLSVCTLCVHVITRL